NPKGVIFDCRTTRAGADWQTRFSYRFAIDLVDQLVSGTVTFATYRDRQHSGYAPQSGATTGGYWSAFVPGAPGGLEGLRKESVPLAFIVDAGTPALEKIVGLQAAARADCGGGRQRPGPGRRPWLLDEAPGRLPRSGPQHGASVIQR